MNNINFQNMQKINEEFKNINYNDLYTKTKPYLNYDVFINILGIYLIISFIDFWLFFRIGLLFYIYKYKTYNKHIKPFKLPTIKLSTIIKNLEDSAEVSSISRRGASIITNNI